MPARVAAALPLALAALLLAPAARAGDGPPPEALAGEVPFADSDETNRIFLELAPENARRDLRVLLDTGANYTAFSPQAAKDAGIRPRRTKDTDYRRKTRLGRDLHIWVDTSYSDHRTETGWNYGLLGGNFLEHFVLEIDFPGRVVRFWNAKKYSLPKAAAAGGEAILPMRLNSRRPVLEVAVNGVTIPVLVDTGAPDGLAVSGDQAEAMGLEAIPGVRMNWGGTVGGTTARFAEAREVRIGPFVLEDVPVFIMPHGFYNLGAQGDAILGYDLLAEFVVRFDYRKGRAWLKHADPGRRLFSLDYAAMREAGVLLDPTSKGDARVWGVLEDGPARARGVRPGDVLPGETSVATLAAALRQGAEITVAREVEDDVWVDTVLPAPEVSGEP